MANPGLKSLVQSQFGANAENYATSRIHAEGDSLVRLVELTGPKPAWKMLDVATRGRSCRLISARMTAMAL